MTRFIQTTFPAEKAVAVGIYFKANRFRDSWPAPEAQAELIELIRSSGLEVIREFTVRMERPVPRTMIGKGKGQEIHDVCHEMQPDVVIFGGDLSAVQQRNLEEAIGMKVIDRTQLILDIFAQRAHSQEGKVQVELAQLEYLLPRLAGQGVMLSRLGGGIGTRGPGEQKLEMDRRRIRQKITRLKEDLRTIHQRRQIARKKREEEEVPTVALIGYTNAGKSTLLNALTHAGTAVENRLFSTLDPLARRLILPDHQPVLLSDTVGFIHKLPHHLVEAFQATLEEVTESRLLLHVLDASHPMMEEQSEAVREVLELLGAQDKPILLAFNKIDRLSSGTIEALKRKYPEAIFISAATGAGLPHLLDRLSAGLSQFMRQADILLGPGQEHWLEQIYSQGKVLVQEGAGASLQLKARLPHRLYGQLKKAGLIRVSS